jgi:hypothetical protein
MSQTADRGPRREESYPGSVIMPSQPRDCAQLRGTVLAAVTILEPGTKPEKNYAAVARAMAEFGNYPIRQS